MWAKAQAQPNIALIKYWGKSNVPKNIPAVDSLSITLDDLWTKMRVEFSSDFQRDKLSVNGLSDTEMLPRVSSCIDSLAGKRRDFAYIESECNFPISAGLASSSSAFSALVVAVNAALELKNNSNALACFAGAVSGSAARSLYGGFVELKSNLDEINLITLFDSQEWPLRIVIAITDTQKKKISSSEAMIRSAGTSPFYSSWVDQQNQDIEIARKAILAKDFEKLAAISEHNCLKMHSIMWTSRPPIVYWNQATLECIKSIRHLQSLGESVFFTIDAGPQVKAICLKENETLIKDTLSQIDGVDSILTSGIGCGASLLGNE